MAKTQKFHLYQFVKKVLRSAFKKTPVYSECLKRATVFNETGEFTKAGKPVVRKFYKCEKCGRLFRATDKGVIAVDHINPVIDTAIGFNGYDDLIYRMFGKWDESQDFDSNREVVMSNFQVLCNYKNGDIDKYDGVKSCHREKSALEVSKLAETRRNKKKAEVK